MLQRFSLTLVLLLSATFALAQDDNWVAGAHYDVI